MPFYFILVLATLILYFTFIYFCEHITTSRTITYCTITSRIMKRRKECWTLRGMSASPSERERKEGKNVGPFGECPHRLPRKRKEIEKEKKERMLDLSGNVRIAFREKENKERKEKEGRMLDPSGDVRITFFIHSCIKGECVSYGMYSLLLCI